MTIEIPDRVAPSFPIRLIALDIDGTLVGDDLVLRPRTIAAVREAYRRGVQISLVTGRMVSSAMRFALELGLTGPIVGYQGAIVRAMPEHPGRLGKLLVHTPMPADVARDIVIWTRENGLDPHLNHLERFIVRADDPLADDYSAFMGARAQVAVDLLRSIEHPVTKVMAVAVPPHPTAMASVAADVFAGRAAVTVSHPRFLEFVQPGVSKGRAVRWLARRLGVPLGSTLAIGDQWNDVEMLAEVGHGAAMPSAPAEVRAVARYLALPLAEEGAADIIERLVLAAPDTFAETSDRLADEAAAAAAQARLAT